VNTHRVQKSETKVCGNTSPAQPHLLSIVIPTLNEEDCIGEVVERCRSIQERLQALNIQSETIVVDDGSQDRTAEVVANLPGVRLVQHGQTRGYGAALKTGFSHARGDLLAFLDADGTYPPEEFPRLCEVAIHENADLVVGSRRSGLASEMPVVRRLGNLIWSTLVTVLANQACADPASGMRVFRRSALPNFYPLPDGLNFTPVMSTRALHEDLKVVELPIPYRERTGRSKLSVIRDGLRFLKTILGTALEYNPAKLLGLVGAVFVCIAAAIGCTLLLARTSGVTSVNAFGAFGVFFALVLAVSGVSIYSLGVTFHFLVSLFHRKPVGPGLFGDSRVEKRFESHFGWSGAAAVGIGCALAGTSMFLGRDSWDIARLWFWFFSSAAFILFGIQLLVCWVLARALERLADREALITEELIAVPAEAASLVSPSGRLRAMPAGEAAG
jgi:glycosyltransferase involved in cell wall biosynthesis